MGTHRDDVSLIAAQRNRFARMERALRIEHAKLAGEMRDVAIDQTSGAISSAELARRGHPFGRGRGRINAKGRMRVGLKGIVPKLPINAQTGELRRSWRLMRRPSASGQVLQLQPTSPHAIVLRPGGTRNMVARGFWTMMRAAYRRKVKPGIQRMRYAALLEARKG